jgi:hypothetical protein
MDKSKSPAFLKFAAQSNFEASSVPVEDSLAPKKKRAAKQTQKNK